MVLVVWFCKWSLPSRECSLCFLRVLKSQMCAALCQMLFCINWYDRFSLSACLYWVLKVKVTQSCPTLCDTRDYTVHGILQARILEWVAFPFSRGSFQPRDQTQVSYTSGRFFTSWATREAHIGHYIDWIFNTELVFYPWTKHYLVTIYSCLFIYCWIPFANTLLRIFVSILKRDMSLQFPRFCIVLVCFCYLGNIGFIQWVGMCSLCFYIWKDLCRMFIL